MNKSQLVDALADRLGDRKTAATAVDALLQIVVDTVRSGDPVSLAGFGVFESRARAARTGRNPRTGESVAVPATTVPAFRPGTGFRNAVAGDGTADVAEPAAAEESPAPAEEPAPRRRRSSRAPATNGSGDGVALNGAVDLSSVPTTTLAGIITLLPGLTVTVAMTELASRHLSSGSARLSAAFIVFASMAFGVALGTTVVTELHGGPVHAAAATALPAWARYVALAFAPLGFALLLRARPRDIPLVFAVSVLGYVSFQFGAAHLGQMLGASIGALSVGLASNLIERVKFAPASVALVPGVLLLVPGSIGYRSLTLVLNQNVETGLVTGITAALTAFGLAGGLIVANVLLPPAK